MDQTSSLTGQIKHTADQNSVNQSDCEDELLPRRSSRPNTLGTIQPLPGLIISRRTPPLSGATTRTVFGGIGETSRLSLSDGIENIRYIHSGSESVLNSTTCATLSLNSILHSHFPPQIAHVFKHILQRSLLAGFESASWSGNFRLQLTYPPNSIEEIEPQNEINLNVMRRQYEEAVLYMHRLADNLLEGSMSVRILPANGVNIRLSLEEQNIPFSSQSLLFYVTDALDHHRAMRLDVDNMSYEELLALEDYIGNVSTGLSEETVLKSLIHSKYFVLSAENAEKDSCSICQEDYAEGDDLGTLNCGHSFHTECIRHWLGCKNLCPICKSTGLYTNCPTSLQIHSL